jgi:hypothetical protein
MTNMGQPGYNKRWQAEVYPVFMDGNDEFSFINDQRSEHESDETKARKWMDITGCWRGVWEFRVYFRDGEYWGEDISTLAAINEHVSKWIKDRIKADNPDYKHFD